MTATGSPIKTSGLKFGTPTTSCRRGLTQCNPQQPAYQDHINLSSSGIQLSGTRTKFTRVSRVSVYQQPTGRIATESGNLYLSDDACDARIQPVCTALLAAAAVCCTGLGCCSCLVCVFFGKISCNYGFTGGVFILV